MIRESRVTLDSSMIIKGMVSPRRKKKDKILEQQLRLYKKAAELLDKVFKGEIIAYIPSAVLVEISAVGSRLTGDSDFGISLAHEIKQICIVLHDKDLFPNAIEIAADTCASGLDNLVYTCAVLTKTPVLTDDRVLHTLCQTKGLKSYLLREEIEKLEGG